MNKFLKQFIETINNYNSFQKALEEKKRHFGDVELYPSEIHTLVYIYEHKGENFTEISQGLGITKGAFSKTLAKLEKKELVKKYYREDNKKNIYFQVSKRGKKSYLAHQAFHQIFKLEVPDDVQGFLKANDQTLTMALMYVNQFIKQLRNEMVNYD